VARVVYAVSVGLLATLLIAPQTTERATKIAVLAALAIVCAARPLLELVAAVVAPSDRATIWAQKLLGRGRIATGAFVLVMAAGFAGLVVLAGIPARPATATVGTLPGGEPLPKVTVVAGTGVANQVDAATSRQIARDIVLDLRANADALRLRDPDRAAVGAGGTWLVALRQQIGLAAGRPIAVSSYRARSVELALSPGAGQGPPAIDASVKGFQRVKIYRGQPPELVRQRPAAPFHASLQVALQQGHYVIVHSAGSDVASPRQRTPRPTIVRPSGPLAGIRLQDVASQVGLDFRQGAFRSGISDDAAAMMGGGVCWLDFNNDGRLDLFVVNSYSQADQDFWQQHGGLPRTALYENVGGSFVDVSKKSGADLAVRGEGCVAADLNGDGYTDLVVTTDSGVELLWNNGNGTFSEGAQSAGIGASGWRSGLAVADVNGDGRPDLFVAGYTELNLPAANALGGFPSNFQGERDLLYLNEGNDSHGHARFREVGMQAGLEAAAFRHGLGAVFTDYNGDGRPDLYVANDEDPNQLYENVPWPGGAAADPAGLGFRFEERGAAEGVADPYAGMGIAPGDFDGSGRLDLFVTNSRREPYAVLRRNAGARSPAFREVRRAFRSAYAGSAGWGASWVDLANDGRPDLVVADGDIPITNLARDAGRIDVFAPRSSGQFANVGVEGLRRSPRVNGRGLAAADYENNGTLGIAVNSIGGPLLLLRTTGAVGHWLEVRTATFSPGAVATAVLPNGRRLVEELHAGSSYLSSEDPRLHFGLGRATRVRTLIVRFPFGREVRLSNLHADQVVVVKPPPVSDALRARRTTSYLRANCASATGRRRSVARIWDEAALAADPGGEDPALQARNLFHLSAAMWDAWDAYDRTGRGYFVTEKHKAANVLAAREAAISFAAYRLLLWRASYQPNMAASFDRLTGTMRALCYDPDFVATRGDSPAALGNRIAAAAIAYGRQDGSGESRHYVDPSYVPVNEPLVVSQPGTPAHDETFWQPLAFGQIVIQGGLPIPAKVQTFAGSQWGHVRGFSLPASKKGLPIDPGALPIGVPRDTAYKRAALDVIRAVAGRRGAAIVGYWAAKRGDPGLWDRIATAVSDARERSSTGADRLAWDVKTYFALNGALHDAAVAAWGAKRVYQSARPISMIRYLAFAGQSTDRRAPSFSADGIPLVRGLVELITKASSAPGQRHASLARHVGDIAIRTANGWVLGTRWLPRGAAVMPSYPGWVSDESAFGAAAAKVLGARTGRPTLPADANLPPWRTYDRAAKEAGLAGLYAGTQIPADVAAGFRVGSEVGTKAWARAARYFAGTGH
jgi:hypothetical protein